MNFDKKDVKTWNNRDNVEVGDKGYFADDIHFLDDIVSMNLIGAIEEIDENNVLCFKKNGAKNFGFFLPEKKVKEPVYRPIKTIDELFNFLIPAFDADTYNTYEKVDVTLLKTYELKDKLTGNICYKRFSQIYISDKYIRLDGCNLELLFKMYEIKKDGKFVPFGVKE